MSYAGKRLAILTHSSDRFASQLYLIRLMIQRWQAMGIQVDVVTERGPHVEADAALLHVDQSVVPEACRQVADRYPLVLNGSVLDIRKRCFSTLLLDRDTITRDANKGKRVIVKSDCNYGGLPELLISAHRSRFWRLMERIGGENLAERLLSLEDLRSWNSRKTLRRYRVYRDSGQVPKGVWRNRNLIVERFVAEREDELYCCRHWLFFGAREVAVRTFSRDPVVKFITGRPAARKAEPLLDPVPDELRAIRAKLGFDYGKFDYGIVDGEVVLDDVNRTPGASRDPRNHERTLSVLPEGLCDLLS